MIVKCEHCGSETEAGEREMDHFFCSDGCLIAALGEWRGISI